MEELKQLKFCKFFLHGYWNITDFDDLPNNGKHCRKCKDNLCILNLLVGTGIFVLPVLIFNSNQALIAGFALALIITGSIHQYLMKYVRAIHGTPESTLNH